MSARLCGYTGPGPCSMRRWWIHRYGDLVHDDIIDDAEVRRGQKAVHSRWAMRHGSRRRLPLHQVDGDGAVSGHARRRSPAPRRDAADDRGRDLSAHQERRRRSHEDEHFDILRRKPPICSAAPPRSAACSGGRGGRPGPREDRFNLGSMSSSWTICWTSPGAADALGKPIGGDLREGRITLPLIHLLHHGGLEAGNLIRNAVRDREISS